MECQHCGQPFDAVRSDALYCGVRCRVAACRQRGGNSGRVRIPDSATSTDIAEALWKWGACDLSPGEELDCAIDGMAEAIDDMIEDSRFPRAPPPVTPVTEAPKAPVTSVTEPSVPHDEAPVTPVTKTITRADAIDRIKGCGDGEPRTAEVIASLVGIELEGVRAILDSTGVRKTKSDGVWRYTIQPR
jgi:hypothetical protein